jgi:16S rRNA (cytosine1402-N4)-methyltransferase
MADEIVDLFAPVPPGWLVDATLGGAGHASALLEAHPHLEVLGIDQDPDALAAAATRLAPFGDRARTARARFDALAAVVAAEIPGQPVVGCLFDLGVSSPQLDRAERGFSYRLDAPLDMRMDPSADVTAAGIVNEAAERDLATIFKRYGEERYAKQIARAIVRRRKEQRFERTNDLVETIKAAIPAPARFGDGHPAKRVFQALRIAVNDELGALESALPSAFAMLRPGGRLAVISFHSLEDRIAKRFMRDLERGCECPPDFPVCVCGKEPQLRSLSRKAIRPGARETAANPRSSSARLRVAVKV